MYAYLYSKVIKRLTFPTLRIKKKNCATETFALEEVLQSVTPSLRDAKRERNLGTLLGFIAFSENEYYGCKYLPSIV